MEKDTFSGGKEKAVLTCNIGVVRYDTLGHVFFSSFTCSIVLLLDGMSLCRQMHVRLRGKRG